MSIVTDALNRVQAERARPAPSPDAGAGPESPSAPGAPKANLFTPQPPSKTIRNILRWSLIIVGVGAVGIGAYLWGLTLMPDVARVSPEHDVIPEAVKESTLDEQIPSQVAEAPPVATLEKELSATTSSSLEEATVSEATEADSSTGIVNNAKVTDSPKPSGEQVASLVKPAPTVPEKSSVPVLPKSPAPPTSEFPQSVETVKSETPKSPTPKDSQASTPKTNTISPKPSNPSKTQIVRNVSPTEAKLIQAKYLIKKRRYRQAVTILKPLFVTPPETWEPWFWLGTAQLGLEEFEQAEESFLEGLARNAAIPHLWVQRALVSQQRGLYGEAVEALRQAELIAPDLPEVQLNLAYSLEAQGHTKNAVEHYHTFLAMTEGKKSYQPARKKVLDRIIRLEKT